MRSALAVAERWRGVMGQIVAMYWMAAAEAAFIGPLHWRRWSDRLISTMNKPPLWIIDMSMAADLFQLRAALTRRLELEQAAQNGITDDVLQMGFLWQRYGVGE